MTRASFQNVPQPHTWQAGAGLLHPKKKQARVFLAIRTDKPQAELYLYKDKEQMVKVRWQAHRELSKTIHCEIQEILNKLSISWDEIEGIVCFKGPGSFTGLRIGLSVANALAYANDIPIVALGGDDWLKKGIHSLESGKTDKIVVPYYDSPAAIALPKK